MRNILSLRHRHLFFFLPYTSILCVCSLHGNLSPFLFSIFMLLHVVRTLAHLYAYQYTHACMRRWWLLRRRGREGRMNNNQVVLSVVRASTVVVDGRGDTGDNSPGHAIATRRRRRTTTKPARIIAYILLHTSSVSQPNSHMHSHTHTHVISHINRAVTRTVRQVA